MSTHRFAHALRALYRRCAAHIMPALPRHTRTRLAGAALAGALLSLAAPPSGWARTPAGPQTGLPVATLTAGGHAIHAEIADTETRRRIGLMHRTDLPDNEGMLFVFDAPDVQCFWMRNTLVPLTIAFISDDGTIVNLADMAPQSDDPHCSLQPVRYALEMAQGWFETHNIAAGQRLAGIPGRP